MHSDEAGQRLMMATQEQKRIEWSVIIENMWDSADPGAWPLLTSVLHHHWWHGISIGQAAIRAGSKEPLWKGGSKRNKRSWQGGGDQGSQATEEEWQTNRTQPDLERTPGGPGLDPGRTQGYVVVSREACKDECNSWDKDKKGPGHSVVRDGQLSGQTRDKRARLRNPHHLKASLTAQRKSSTNPISLSNILHKFQAIHLQTW